MLWALAQRRGHISVFTDFKACFSPKISKPHYWQMVARELSQLSCSKVHKKPARATVWWWPRPVRGMAPAQGICEHHVREETGLWWKLFIEDSLKKHWLYINNILLPVVSDCQTFSWSFPICSHLTSKRARWIQNGGRWTAWLYSLMHEAGAPGFYLFPTQQLVCYKLTQNSSGHTGPK